MQVGEQLILLLSSFLLKLLNKLDLELDESDKEDEGPKDKKDGEGPPPKPPLEMSEQIQFLLETLDFNQIDSYR